MSGALSYQDGETARKLRAIAAEIFTRHGVDFRATREGGGWTNASWIGGGLVLRLSLQEGAEKIRREVQLAALLTPDVGYPEIVEAGVSDGLEWSLAREIPGESLGAAWGKLNWGERASALTQLWNKAEAVHGVSMAAVGGLARERAWYNSNDAAEAEAGLARLLEQGVLDRRQVGALRDLLACFWQALPAGECALNHGDLTLDNAMWHEGNVVSLLDFEWAVIAPPALDLNTFLKHAFGPEREEEPEEDRAGLRRLRECVAAAVRPLLAKPGMKELLPGYAVLLELWQLQDWLAHPEGEGPMEGWEPYRRICALADGNGGYLAWVRRLV